MPTGSLKHGLSRLGKSPALASVEFILAGKEGLAFIPPSRSLLHKQNCTSPSDTFLYEARLHFTL